jgi:hypothetical protein
VGENTDTIKKNTEASLESSKRSVWKWIQRKLSTCSCHVVRR